MPVQTCPEPAQLQALVLGRLDDAQAERLEAHVERCAQCGGRLGTLPAEDTLVAAMRARARVALPPTDLTALQDLLPRLRRLRPTASSATPYPQGASAMHVNVDTQEFLGPPQSADEIGRLGPYRVLKRLGQGGMGMVFLAEDPSLQRTVALKVMLPEVAKKAVARERFLREARATAKIEHDHIVTIYQVGEDRGVPYLAMQLLKGCSLEDYLRKKQGAAAAPLTVDQVLKLGREIAKGLAAAHARGLIHRDIKPANIWLDATAGGRVKILDFGLARPAEEDAHLTQSGVIVGTAAYMAPEQARGERLDARADLFSLGCVLYRLCTGRLPWKGCDVMATLIAVATEPPMPILDLNPDLPAPFARLVMQLLAKRPEERPASAKAVADAILALERAQPTVQIKMALPVAALTPPAPPRHDVAETTGMLLTQPLTPAPSSRPRRRRLAGAVAAAFLLGGLTLGAVFYVQTDTGTLKIESDDPDVQVVIEQNGKQIEVLDKKKGTKVVLHSGEYRLRLGDASKDIKLDKDRIQITRAGVVVVTISKVAGTAKGPAKYERNSLGMDLALIPIGEFVMGAAEEETGRIKGDFKPWASEGPQHRVKITRPFWMGATHVTIAQYRKFLADSKHQPEGKHWDKVDYQTDEYPVTNVTWNDAAAFCKWLSEKEGRKYRLPTEAEWEYACRAGSQTAFFFGDDPEAMGRYAWFKGNSEGKTHPVGTKQPNQWGLYDMHGLAYQWTADWFAPDYYQKSPEKDPQGPGPTTGGERKEPSKVMRGGEWWYDAWHCRSASRKDRTPNYSARTGFRVVRD